MKKLIVFILCAAVMPFALFGCDSGSTAESTASPSESGTTEQAPDSSEGETKQSFGINLIEENGLYTVTVPVDYIAFGELTPEEFAAQNGYEKIALDDTCENYLLTMTAQKHAECLEDIRTNFVTSSDSFKQTMTFITDVAVGDEYSVITISVEREAYTSSGTNTAAAAVTLGTYACIYRAYSGFNPSVNVKTVYSDTGEVVTSVTIPQYA